MIILMILCGFLIGSCVFFYIKYQTAQKEANTRIKLNQQTKLENELLAQQNSDLKITQAGLKAEIDIQKQRMDELQEYAETQAQEAVEKAYEGYSEEIEKEYKDIINNRLTDYLLVCSNIEEAKIQLSDLQAKQTAYIEEQLRKEKIQKDLDFYRMVLSQDDKDDISHLREVQRSFHRKEAIDKVIWEVYYKPAYDILMSHLFKKGQDKVCGIYKITSLTSGKIYIGQSVDIRTRWRDHIKSALVTGNKTNLLYSAMAKEFPENFTFEILEEVPRAQLNEREKYYIDFYQSAKVGLNKTSGGS